MVALAILYVSKPGSSKVYESNHELHSFTTEPVIAPYTYYELVKLAICLTEGDEK